MYPQLWHRPWTPDATLLAPEAPAQEWRKEQLEAAGKALAARLTLVHPVRDLSPAEQADQATYMHFRGSLVLGVKELEYLSGRTDDDLKELGKHLCQKYVTYCGTWGGESEPPPLVSLEIWHYQASLCASELQMLEGLVSCMPAYIRPWLAPYPAHPLRFAAHCWVRQASGNQPIFWRVADGRVFQDFDKLALLL